MSYTSELEPEDELELEPFADKLALEFEQPTRGRPRAACGVRLQEISSILTALNAKISVLYRIRGVQPRDQRTWDQTVAATKGRIEDLKAAFKSMSSKLRDGTFEKSGCTDRDFDRVADQVWSLRLTGGWEKHRVLSDERNKLLIELQAAAARVRRGRIRLW